MKPRHLIVFFLAVPTLCFAGYGWQTYVDPLIAQLRRQIALTNQRVQQLEARVAELEKATKVEAKP